MPPTPSPGPTREVHVADAMEWLAVQGVLRGCSLMTSLPDVSETGMSLPRWHDFFVEAARRVCAAVPPEGLAVFVQTDLRRDGAWIDKAALVAAGAAAADAQLLCKKIVCRRPPGSRSSAGASFSSMLVYGRGRTLDPALPDLVPDVLVEPGPPTWVRGLGRDACAHAVRFLQRYAPSTSTVVDPFCGEGMTLAVANALGLRAIGVERNRKRAEKARTLVIAPDAIVSRVPSGASARPR